MSNSYTYDLYVVIHNKLCFNDKPQLIVLKRFQTKYENLESFIHQIPLILFKVLYQNE